MTSELRDANGLPVRPPHRGSSGVPPPREDEAHGPIYRAIGAMETRLADLENEFEAHRVVSAQDRHAIHGQLGRHVAVLRLVQTRLNLVLVLMISVALFALAGPAGLAQIGSVIAGHASAIGVDGIATLAGLAIPFLYPLGRRIFLSVRPESKPEQEAEYGREQDH